MDRRNFYLAQKVAEAELDDAFAQVEAAETAIKTDMFAGANGFLANTVTVAQESTGTLRVDVGTGLGWDRDGFRVSNPNAQQFADFTGDDDPTDPRIVALYLGFDRALSDPRVDGLGATVNFKVDETFVFNKVLGTPAPSPTAPAADPSQGILLAHVTVPAAAGAILTANIDATVQNLQSSFPPHRLAGALSAVSRGYISNVKIVTTGNMPTDVIDVERATAVNGGSSPDRLMNVANAPIDLGGTLGPGALDVGVVANATYYVYLIGDSKGIEVDDVIASLDAGPGYAGAGPSFVNAPGYDRFRLIGCIIRAAGEIIPFRQIGNVTRFDDTILTTVFGPGGDPHTGGGPGVGSGFVTLSLSPYVPAISERAYLRMQLNTTSAVVPDYHFRSRGGGTFTPATDYTNSVDGGSGPNTTQNHSESDFPVHVDTSQLVDWERSETATASTVSIHVTGFMVDLHHD